MTIKARIEEFISEQGIKRAVFERSCGFSNGYTRNLKENPSAAKIEDILTAYPELNRIWLLTGEGEMLKSDAQAAPKPATDERTGSSFLPLIPVDAVAGFPSFDTEGISLQDCSLYQIPDFAAKGAQFLIRVSGSSMYPKYSNGDILACRKVETVTFLQWGKVYVLDTCQGALVKRLFANPDDPDSVLCHSDNSDNYPRFSLPKSEIRSLSIVVGVIRVE